MILGSVTKEIRAYLAGAVATNQPEWTSSWADHDAPGEAFTPDGELGLLNDTTPVTLIDVPPANVQRQAKQITVFNADTANVVVVVDQFDGTNARRWIQALLEPEWSLQWEPGGTWHVYDENGVLQTSGSGGSSGVTVEEADGAPSRTGVTTIRFDQADGFVVSNPGAGVARVDLTSSASTAYRRWAYMFR